MIQGCAANSYDANSYDLANSYGFSGKNLNLFTMIFSTFYRLPTRKFKWNLQSEFLKGTHKLSEVFVFRNYPKFWMKNP